MPSDDIKESVLKDSAELTKFFNPESIAVVGASRLPGKVGYGVLKNILQ